MMMMMMIGSNTQISISSISAGTLSNAYNPNWRRENRRYDGWYVMIFPSALILLW